MPVEREVIQFVGAADFTDDCRVVVKLRKKRMTLTITEARALMAEMFVAIQEAQRGANDLARDVEPAGFDLLTREPISPDCAAGKHPVHADEAWDDVADVEVPCACPCHTEEVAA